MLHGKKKSNCDYDIDVDEMSGKTLYKNVIKINGRERQKTEAFTHLKSLETSNELLTFTNT